MSDIAFALNYQHITEVNIEPLASEPKWAWVGPGIVTISQDKSETSNEDAYYDGGGNTTTSVTGLSRSYSVEGDRKYGDEFQDWVASLDDLMGSELNTSMRITNPDGECIERDITIHEIVAKGPTGDANDKSSFSCTLACNGMPRLIDAAQGLKLPDSVEANTVEVAAGDYVNVVPTVLPEDSSQRCLYAIENDEIATVSSDGVVTGLVEGNTRLTIKCASKPSVGVTVDVIVSAATDSEPDDQEP